MLELETALENEFRLHPTCFLGNTVARLWAHFWPWLSGEQRIGNPDSVCILGLSLLVLVTRDILDLFSTELSPLNFSEMAPVFLGLSTGDLLVICKLLFHLYLYVSFPVVLPSLPPSSYPVHRLSLPFSHIHCLPNVCLRLGLGHWDKWLIIKWEMTKKTNSDYGRRDLSSLGMWEQSESRAPPRPSPKTVAVASCLRQGSIQLNGPLGCSSSQLQPVGDTAQSSLCAHLTTPWITRLRSTCFGSHHFSPLYMWSLWGLLHSSIWMSGRIGAKDFPGDQIVCFLIHAQEEELLCGGGTNVDGFSRQLVAEQDLEVYKDHLFLHCRSLKSWV